MSGVWRQILKTNIKSAKKVKVTNIELEDNCCKKREKRYLVPLTNVYIHAAKFVYSTIIHLTLINLPIDLCNMIFKYEYI